MRFFFTNRINLLNARETSRPPSFVNSSAVFGKCLNDVLRLIDLQASSIYSDLSQVLPSVNGTFLDVGCGAQPYRHLLAKNTQYIGIDTDDSLVRFGYQNLGTVYYRGGCWPVGAASQDTVMATETLEHVSHPSHFIAEARRVLKSEGWLILTVPFAVRWHCILHNYWRFTPSGLKLLLTEAGFTRIEVYGRGNAATVACYKNLSLILGLMFGCYRYRLTTVMARLVGVSLLPVVLVLNVIGQLSLKFGGGCDTLGYTVFARREK